MAFTYGFYNSLNHDRKYSAEQISALFDGLISDGVFDNVGEIFATVPGTDGLSVIVKSGKAWFNHTWSLNDSWFRVDLDTPDVLQSRIDAIVLDINTDPMVRANSIHVVKGTPAVSPSKPTLTNTDTHHQYALSYVTVRENATSITTADIENMVGRGSTPFVTGVIDSVAIDDLFNKWNGEFSSWFDNLKDQLSDNVVTNLQGQIDERVKYTDKATTAEAIAGTDNTKYLTPLTGQTQVDNRHKVGDIVASVNFDDPNWVPLDGRIITQASYPKLAEMREPMLLPFVTTSVLCSGGSTYSDGYLPNVGYEIQTSKLMIFKQMASSGTCGIYSINKNGIIRTIDTLSYIPLEIAANEYRMYAVGMNSSNATIIRVYNVSNENISYYKEYVLHSGESVNQAKIFLNGQKVSVIINTNSTNYPIAYYSPDNFESYSIVYEKNVNRGGLEFDTIACNDNVIAFRTRYPYYGSNITYYYIVSTNYGESFRLATTSSTDTGYYSLGIIGDYWITTNYYTNSNTEPLGIYLLNVLSGTIVNKTSDFGNYKCVEKRMTISTVVGDHLYIPLINNILGKTGLTKIAFNGSTISNISMVDQSSRTIFGSSVLNPSYEFPFWISPDKKYMIMGNPNLNQNPATRIMDLETEKTYENPTNLYFPGNYGKWWYSNCAYIDGHFLQYRVYSDSSNSILNKYLHSYDSKTYNLPTLYGVYIRVK